jgi:hypothetical protein
MITIDGNNQRAVRETTVPFEYTEKGELKAQTIRVRYYATTVKEDRERYQAQVKMRKDNPLKITWKSESLVKRIESLPDLKLPGKDGKGEAPFEITAENLEQLDLRNLEAIEDAIIQDTAPKATPVP